eukprot:Trichotokara_eunicae@DN7834_c0_g1_i2.p1
MTTAAAPPVQQEKHFYAVVQQESHFFHGHLVANTIVKLCEGQVKVGDVSNEVEKLRYVLSLYQEQPELLDENIKDMMAPLRNTLESKLRYLCDSTPRAEALTLLMPTMEVTVCNTFGIRAGVEQEDRTQEYNGG